MATRKPALRVSQWLSGTIPLEATCTACPDLHFKAAWEARHTLQASREQCVQALQQQFDKHVRLVHSDQALAEKETSLGN